MPFWRMKSQLTHNHEQLSLCLRFIDAKHNIREEFVKFCSVKRTTGLELAAHVTKALESFRLPLCDIRGQGYDGPAIMSSSRVGVQARIKEESPLAVYSHCSGHCLNLVLSHSCSLPIMRNMIDKLKEACLFFNQSPKREGLPRAIIAVDEAESARKKPLLDLCCTHWAARQDAYNHFHSIFVHIIVALEVITHGLHQDRGYDPDFLTDWSCECSKNVHRPC